VFREICRLAAICRWLNPWSFNRRISVNLVICDHLRIDTHALFGHGISESIRSKFPYILGWLNLSERLAQFSRNSGATKAKSPLVAPKRLFCLDCLCLE
jgi:hypothetical protein